MVLLRVPPRVGENVTATVHCWPGVSVLPEQPSEESGNSVELLDVTLLITRFAVPVFFTLKSCALLVVPTFCVGKLRVVGDSATAGPAVTALPVRVIVRGLPVAASVSVTVAVRVPLEVDRGENVTAIAHVFLALI
jgi:hypothetical protein